MTKTEQQSCEKRENTPCVYDNEKTTRGLYDDDNVDDNRKVELRPQSNEAEIYI